MPKSVTQDVPIRATHTISKEALKAYIKMYEETYGIRLTDEEAIEYSNQLLTLVKAVYGKNLPNRFDKKRRNEK